MTSNEPDLHVAALYYDLEIGDSVRFEAPPPVSWDTELATFDLRDGRLTCATKQHFADWRDAVNAVDPLVRAWEIHAALQIRPGVVGFRFTNVDVIDRRPLAQREIRGTAVLVEGIGTSEAFGTAQAISLTGNYPAPSPHFRLNPDVETLWQRLQGHLAGREPLQAMAYFCLTWLEARGRKIEPGQARKTAADLFNVSKKILDKLAELTEKGDPATARKAKNLTPLTPQESNWVLAALKALIYLVGDTRPASGRPKLSMSDLPRLP